MELQNEKGAALVELAITIFLLVLILFGTIEFGRAMYIRNNLNLAAREGARMASVTPNLATKGTGGIVDYVTTYIPAGQQAGLSVSVTSSPGGFTTGSTITVTVSQPFTPVVPLLVTQLADITLSGQASMLYEY